MDTKVQVYIMSHDRPSYLVETLHSLQKQTHDNFELIVSENSSDGSVAQLLQQQFPQIKTLRRLPMLSMSQHWNQIISEISSPYFMMFHDDDLLMPSGLKALSTALDHFPKAAAAAGNALIVRDSLQTDEVFNKGLRSQAVLQGAADLGPNYFDPNRGVQPFPGYLYRTELCQQIRVNPREAGKHSDVTYLMKCLRLGSVVWIPDVTMRYRYHQTNDTHGLDILSLSRLVHFYQRAAGLPRTDFLSSRFLIRNYIHWMRIFGRSSLRAAHPFRYKAILRRIQCFFLRHPAELAFVFLRRLRTKTKQLVRAGS